MKRKIIKSRVRFGEKEAPSDEKKTADKLIHRLPPPPISGSHAVDQRRHRYKSSCVAVARSLTLSDPQFLSL